MNTIKKALLIATVALVSQCWAASPTATLLKNRASYNTDIATAVAQGKWVSNFFKAKTWATANRVPFVAVWSNGDSCGHCVNFEKSVNSADFRNYMKTSGVVFYFTYYGDKGNGTTKKSGSKADNGSEGGDIFHWVRGNKMTSYPFVRVYWPAGKVDLLSVGDTLDGNGVSGSKCIKWLQNTAKLKNFKPTPPKPAYTGASFVVGDTETDRLEAEIGKTAKVDVPLARTNTVVSTTSTNTVVITGVSPEVRQTILWESGDAETNVTVSIPASATSGAKIELVLLDAAGQGVATSHITMVTAPANTPSNPYWIGEKTEAELNWGEWTMDLDVATNKVNAYNAGKGTSTAGNGAALMSAASDKDRAYTLVLLEGALWCPDCKNTDANLFLRPEFKTWAEENKVALVALDLPRVPTDIDIGPAKTYTAPTLLTTVSASGCSGAGYLSRKMADKEAAEDALERNFELGYSLRLPNWANKNRPPVPSLFVLRNDGTVAGRLQQFGAKSPTDASNIGAHIKRLNELLLQVDDPAEEANDEPSWTKETLGPRTNVVKTLSLTDAKDVYRLDPEKTLNKRLAFTLTGSAAVNMQLKLVADNEILDSSEGLLTEGDLWSAGAEIKSSNCYVTVSYPTNENYFAIASPASTLCTYTLSTDFVVEPTELAADNTLTLEDGVKEVTVALVSNQLYRITNLDLANDTNVAALVPTNGPGPADNLYLAKITGDVRLQLTAAETVIQKWNPGTIGFSISSASVLESAGSYSIRLVRRGGMSGTARASAAFNPEKSSKYENLFTLPDGFEDEFEWREGETDERSRTITIVENIFADGDQPLYFNATVGGDAAPGIEQFRLTLRDNDKKVPGKIAITGTTPAMAKDMTTFARAGTPMKLELTRVDGTTGELEVSLATSAGTLDATSFCWSNRVSAAKEATLTLPETTGKVKATMTAKKGSYVDGKRRILTVNVLPADIPGFVQDKVRAEVTRYVPMIEPVSVAVDGNYVTDWAKVRVAKFSGTVPAGLSWKYDADGHCLVMSGVPTKAGTFTSVFRVSEGTKAGLTVAVTVDVVDPVLKGGGENGAAPLNPSVATTRTFADVPVFDETEARLAGVFTLTVPRTGRLSAKYRGVDAGTVTLASKTWSAIGADGTLSAELSGKMADGTPCTMAVWAHADGTVYVEVDFDGPLVSATSFKVLLPGATWSKKYPATDFKGYYTVSLPQTVTVSGTPRATGAGCATLKMNTVAAINAGKFTYAGMLPDGRTFSGSAVATPDKWQDATSASFWSRAVVPVVCLGSLNTFSGAFQVTPGAADANATSMYENGLCKGRCFYKTIRRSVAPAEEAKLFWRHVEQTADESYEVELDAYGTYYVATDNFASCCQTTFQNTMLRFFVQDEGADQDSVAWPTNGAPSVTVAYTAKTKANAIRALANTRGLTLSFTPSTGIVSGSFTLAGKKLTYKGVVMPGWGSDGCTTCGFDEDNSGGVEAQLRPFISGAAWFNDTVKFEVSGRKKTISVRHGCPFSIGTQTGR